MNTNSDVVSNGFAIITRPPMMMSTLNPIENPHERSPYFLSSPDRTAFTAPQITRMIPSTTEKNPAITCGNRNTIRATRQKNTPVATTPTWRSASGVLK